MIPVAVIGATGRTGSQVVATVLSSRDLSLVVAAGRSDSPHLGRDIGSFSGLDEAGLAVTPLKGSSLRDAKVVIDFSSPTGLDRLLDILGDRPLVTGTTGLDASLEARLDAQAQRAPVLTAANFSTGINLLLDLVHRAARSLPSYDIEIVEAHHRHKVDAPSGTALALATAAGQARHLDLDTQLVHGRSGQVGARTQAELGIHAVRAGGIVGEHEVWLVGEGERIKLSHTAFARSTFAHGAVRAARWLHDKPPGRYTMHDVLGLDPADR
ncbi:MAG: 4-hydroxy-tetrahydrodipicolinate reductase [Deltaproteobacteria bacterium]|nr:MAG: 4-hydroxy-tetrahydrodipicolinate reductase [Deltaproteobacteria bacterium]